MATMSFKDEQGRTIPSVYEIRAANSIRLELSLQTSGSESTTDLQGTLTCRGVPVGSFARTSKGVFTQNWYSGFKQPIYVKDQDTVVATITTPGFTQSYQIKITRSGTSVVNKPQYGSLVQVLRAGFLSGNDTHPNNVIHNTVGVINGYSPIKYSEKVPENINNIEGYVRLDMELPPVITPVYSTPEELNMVLSTLKPVTMETMFNEWPRYMFSQNGAGQQFWINPATATGDARAWQWVAASKGVNMPLNSDYWSGTVSAKKYDHFDFEITVRSTDADDDWNAIVIAHNWDGIINRLLMVTVSSANNAASDLPYGTNLVVYQGGAVNLGLRPNLSDPRPGGGWSGKYRKMGVYRRGDDVTVKISPWNQTVFSEALTITFNLNDDVSFEVFKGPQAYGYSNCSQASTVFSDVYFDGGERMESVVDVLSGTVYTYNQLSGWVIVPGLTPHQIYGAPRILIDSESGSRYRLNTDGSVTTLEHYPIIDSTALRLRINPKDNSPIGDSSQYNVGMSHGAGVVPFADGPTAVLTHGFKMDGTINAPITVPAQNLLPPSGNFTIDFWYKSHPSETRPTLALVSKWPGITVNGTATGEFILMNDYLLWGRGIDVAVGFEGRVDGSIWNHYVMVVKDNTVSVRVNDVLMGSATVAPMVVSSAPWVIGSYLVSNVPSATYVPNGTFADFKIYQY